MSVRCLLAGWLALAGAPALAQSLESVLSPGPLIEAHARAEGECRNCHVPFKRDAQNALCLECHKEIGVDVRGHTGFHGRLEPRLCRACHTDHRGREAQIVRLDERTFDHGKTDFALRGAHADPKVECRACHRPKKKYREAPGRCVDCHAKQDVHKGRLGAQCADCHSEASWKQARFDHGKTHFPLHGAHAPLKCASCHKAEHFKDTPTACVACHRKDDAHKGTLGTACGDCHTDANWKQTRFDHARTRFPLRGAHAPLKCASCHKNDRWRETPSTCVACHRKDDRHKGSLGAACGDCHSERDWKVGRFDHAKTRFPLLGRHAGIRCDSCHKSAVFKDVPGTCIGCHRKDDRHKGALGENCAACHTARNWKESSFDHAKTAFPLLGSHARVKCESCHRDTDYRRTPRDCLGCHKKDDVHAGQLGAKCDACHDAGTWKKARFDHGRTRFPLLGGHLVVPCAKCHASKRYQDAQPACAACHARDDVHKRRLGPACDTCHNARAWRSWDFDHAQRAHFALDGAHAKLACDACHRAPVDGPPKLASSCASCHASDDVHDGGFGRQCEKCHVTSSFKTIRRRVGMIGTLQ